jgi:hypothetical protein
MTIQQSEKKKQVVKAEKKARSNKSPSELETQFKKDVAYAVDRMDQWANKLVRKLSGRKYHLTNTETEKMLTAINAMVARIDAAAKPKNDQAVGNPKGFSFDE